MLITGSAIPGKTPTTGGQSNMTFSIINFSLHFLIAAHHFSDSARRLPGFIKSKIAVCDWGKMWSYVSQSQRHSGVFCDLKWTACGFLLLTGCGAEWQPMKHTDGKHPTRLSHDGGHKAAVLLWPLTTSSRSLFMFSHVLFCSQPHNSNLPLKLS